ncbi:hypothetical protein M378DRAFT_993223 [Amanita muscaria Koide BX008]|uniref:Uncharacterized protein n=1 Tax=Amanita muscaria (strain Koide BX008) TaxID=946122 RepID=A0A0C2TLH3_AMAMK|nr:hypothetical protein M378DRAFT_993223 [Amanita muscaria Koide BX008]
MDFFLAIPLSVDTSTTKQDLGIHHMILQMLSFAVGFFLFDKDLKLWSKQRTESHTRPSVEQAVLEAIDGLIKGIYDTSRTILGSLHSTNIEGQMEVFNVMPKILNYGRYLCNINCNLIDHSTLISLAQCISDTVSTQGLNLHALQEQARHFNQTVSLSLGLGLFDIWASLYTDEAAYPRGTIIRIDELASSLKKTLECVGLRKRTLDYLALATLPNTHGTDRGGISELGQELEHLLSGRSEQDGAKSSRHIGSTFLVVELSLLSLPTDDKLLEMLAKEFIDMATAMDNTSLLRVVPYKHLLWFLESGKVPLSLTSRMHVQWLYDVCGLREQAQEVRPQRFIQSST